MSERWYPAGGTSVPSVTTVLQVRFPGPVAKDEETAARWLYLRDRGTDIHDLIAQGIIPKEQMDALPDDVQQALYAWQRFVYKWGFKALHNEVELIDAELGYGGRMDSEGHIPAGRVILDWKSGRLKPAYAGMQLGAYYGLYAKKYPRRKLIGGLGVRLDCKTGNFEVMSMSLTELKLNHRAFMKDLVKFNEKKQEELCQ